MKRRGVGFREHGGDLQVLCYGCARGPFENLTMEERTALGARSLHMKPEGAKLLGGIPDYQVFFTLDQFDASSRELAARYPETVTLLQIGTSRAGRPILCLKIGDGAENVLMMGCPHPNEPIGAMLLEYLSESLAGSPSLRRAYPYTWYIIKVWDVDGYRLNEGWLHGPFTITDYARHVFRPAGVEQVDWTFPIDYKGLHFHNCLPETLAVKDLIDKIRPKFIYSLHNSGFGGVYWYMTRALEGIFQDLWKIPEKNGMPLSLGMAESDSSVPFGNAVFQTLGICARYDHLEKYGAPGAAEAIRCGDTSAAYADRAYNSFTLMTELPYFYDPRVENQSAGSISLKEGMLKRDAENSAMSKELRDILAISKSYLGQDNPFMRAVESFSVARGVNTSLENLVNSDSRYLELATKAEEFDLLYVSKFYKLLSYGMLVRANEKALAEWRERRLHSKEAEETIAYALGAAKAAFQRLAAYLEEHLHYKVVPIKNMIAVQLESGLIVLEELGRRGPVQ